MSDKPIKARPHFYAVIFPSLVEIAREMGYNLIVHGSLNRDMDLVAIPWIDEPKKHIELLQELHKFINGHYHEKIEDYMFSMLPGGRYSYVINIERGGPYNGYFDSQYYLDISITPCLKYHNGG